MECCTYSLKGKRPAQEDRAACFKSNNGDIWVTLVADGHASERGGAQVAQAVVDAHEQLLPRLSSSLFRQPAEFRQFIKRSYSQIDDWILREFPRVAEDAGSTCCAAFYDRASNAFYTVNLGDSRAIFFEVAQVSCADVEIVPTTYHSTLLHKPNAARELRRIEEAGGVVQTSSEDSNVARVGGVLALSRAFGDFSLKRPFNKSAGDWVSNVPDVRGPFFPRDDFICAIGSDGVFDMMGTKELKEMIVKQVSENQCAAPGDSVLRGVCKTIVDECIQRWKESPGADNVTAAVLYIPPS